jgi:hypothetical protein
LAAVSLAAQYDATAMQIVRLNSIRFPVCIVDAVS